MVGRYTGTNQYGWVLEFDRRLDEGSVLPNTGSEARLTDLLKSYSYPGGSSVCGLWRTVLIHLKTWFDAWSTTIQPSDSGGAGTEAITFGICGTRLL